MGTVPSISKWIADLVLHHGTWSACYVMKRQALPLSLLEEITDGFSDEHQIGMGGFAVVYKGKLPTRNVAVKRMSNAYMDEKAFHREVQCLMMAKHKNVVRFLGYCADTQGSMEKYEGKFVMADVQQRFLCFEYLPKGSLHEHIADTPHVLQWRDCYQIITGICQGLHFLHQKNIVHLDLKPANILLDENWVPKIADFGISRCFDEMQSQAITKIYGTFGYLAPESFNHTEITYRHSYRLDIYSLGVVILEILIGKKGYHDVDKVLESWINISEKSRSDVLLKHVRVCAEIGIECINFNPTKRPDTQYVISKLNDYIETDLISSQQINQDILAGTMHKLRLSYQQLNPDIRRCIEYCIIFPKGSKLTLINLVHLWIAQGFVKTSCTREDMEDVAVGYFLELVSYSFLQPQWTWDGIEYFKIHDQLHDFIDMVTRTDYFRIYYETGRREKCLKENITQCVRHLFVHKYNPKMVTGNILGWENLHTLIMDVVDVYIRVDEKVIESICKRLPKLRVLAIAFSHPIKQLKKFSVPECIVQLKHLCYLAFRTDNYCKITLPSTLNELQHIQVLDFGDGNVLEFTFAEISTLRHIICSGVEFPNIGRLTTLQTIPKFRVRNKQGYEVKQLRDLNKLCGSLMISGLENVKSKEEALEANLAAKVGLTDLNMQWGAFDDTRGSREVEAEVLEGLCPPMGLKTLRIFDYEGSRYPDWMVGKQNGGPKVLQHLELSCCIQLGGLPSELVECFPRLRVLELRSCSMDALPSNMEQLTSLMELVIHECRNIRSLPTLPQSLEEFTLFACNYEFEMSCETVGHPNWRKIEHIPNIYIR